MLAIDKKVVMDVYDLFIEQFGMKTTYLSIVPHPIPFVGTFNVTRQLQGSLRTHVVIMKEYEQGGKEGLEPSQLGSQPRVLTYYTTYPMVLRVGVEPTAPNGQQFYKLHPLPTEYRSNESAAG